MFLLLNNKNYATNTHDNTNEEYLFDTNFESYIDYELQYKIKYFCRIIFLTYLISFIINYYIQINNMGCTASNILKNENNEDEKTIREIFEKTSSKMKYSTHKINLESLSYYQFNEINEIISDNDSLENVSLDNDSLDNESIDINSSHQESFDYEKLLNRNIYIDCNKFEKSLLEKLITSYFNNDNNMNIENTHIKLYGKWDNENNEVFDNIFQCKFTNILNKINNTEMLIDIMEDVCLGNTCKVYILSNDGNLAFVLEKIKKNYPHIELVLPWMPYISKKIKKFVTDEK